MEFFLLSLQIWAASVSPNAANYKFSAVQYNSYKQCIQAADAITTLNLLMHGNATVYNFKCIIRIEI